MLRHAGIGRYVSNVVPRVIAARPGWEFTLLGPADTPAWGSSRVVACDSHIYSVREQLELRSRTPNGASVFWSPHYNVPLLSAAPLVVTVHDIAHLRLPQFAAGPAGVAKRAYARFMFTTVRRRSRAVLFDSQFTQAEFEREVGVPHLSAVTALGVDPSWSSLPAAQRPQERRYLLFVGSVKPHKNLPRLIEAFRAVSSDIEHDLVIAGSWRGQRTLDRDVLASAGAVGGRVRLVEAPSDETLATYMAHADALILPSLYEGFGLPAVEAMTLGCPCIVSNTSSLPEICGDAGVYVDPLNASDIAAKIVMLVKDDALRARLSAEGRRRAAGFDWNVTAERTATVIERVLNEVG